MKTVVKEGPEFLLRNRRLNFRFFELGYFGDRTCAFRCIRTHDRTRNEENLTSNSPRYIGCLRNQSRRKVRAWHSHKFSLQKHHFAYPRDAALALVLPVEDDQSTTQTRSLQTTLLTHRTVFMFILYNRATHDNTKPAHRVTRRMTWMPWLSANS